MITATGLELRAGARILIDDATFRVGRATGSAWSAATAPARPPSPGSSPARASRPAGTVTAHRRRRLPARRTRAPATSTSSPATGSCPPAELDSVLRRLRETEGAMASADDETREQAMERYSRLEAEFTARGGYAAEAEAATIASSLGLPERVLGQPLRTLSGGQRRRVELARILFSGAADPAARRADQPPRRRLDRLAARLPAHPQGRAGGHQPRRRAARGAASTGSSTWTPTGPRSTSTTSAGRPTCSSARPTSGGASGSGPTPRRRPRR